MAEGRFKVLVEDRFGTVTDEYTFDAGEFILGRSRQCDVILPGDNVSRRHAKLFTKDNALFIQDLDSANGTFVNGKRITKPTLLVDGSVFRIGDFHIHTHGGPEDLETDKVYLRLIGMDRTVKDEIFEIKDKTALVGRGNDCQIVVIDPSISRVHARFLVMDDGTVLLKDMGSANGVFKGDEPIRSACLAPGDRVLVGQHELLVKGAHELNEAARLKLYVEAQQVILQDAPWQPLYNPLDVVAISKRIEGTKIGYMGRLLVNDAHVVGE